jgi:allophanate hydrolase
MTAHPHTIGAWLRAYRSFATTPVEALQAWRTHLATDDPAWIHVCTDEQLQEQLHALASHTPSELPLYGVPFAVKDNIDVAGWVTTAACPDFAFTAQRSAEVVLRLQAAGAVVVGKTNMDQFATGLVGTRSPYGAVPNSFDARYISGGSSSGSASVVSRGLVPFALGTDTAGSGRVPAGLNHLVGLKPTPGLVPMRGVLPACKTLDVVSIFALNVADAAMVLAQIEGVEDEALHQRHAPRAPWLGRLSKPFRVGVPREPALDVSLGYDLAHYEAVEQLHSLGAEVIDIDMKVMDEVASMLYQGPWVAERDAVVGGVLAGANRSVDPTVATVIAQAKQFSATDSFRARYRLADCAQTLRALWQDVDMLMVPTTPTCPTLEAVARDPISRNNELGRYTNFVNLLGWAAIAMPASISSSGLPYGVTFIAPGGSDAALVAWSKQWEAARAQRAGAVGVEMRMEHSDPMETSGLIHEATMQLAVVGAHLSGMPLHSQILERGCRLVAITETAAHYRLYALPNTKPPKPGLQRVAEGLGTAITVEVYEMPLAQVGSFLALIPPPLGLGNLELADGRWVKGFICESNALEGAQDISAFGGWRNFIAEGQVE